jgi:membrane-associated phospholipid phosphatase
MNKLLQLDRQIFQVINNRWQHDFFDTIFPFLRNSNFWLPLYLFLLLFALVNFKKNRGWWIFYAAGTVILSNYLSSDIIKENIFRLRPCNDPDLADSYQGTGQLQASKFQLYFFAFSESFCHGRISTMVPCTRSLGNGHLLFFVWAISICYAQVYVGVHFPLDVICGGLIGLVLGYLSARSFNNNYQLV